jgi:hypothetical protein
LILYFLIAWCVVGGIAAFASTDKTRDWSTLKCFVVGFLLGPVFWLVALVLSVVAILIAIFE